MIYTNLLFALFTATSNIPFTSADGYGILGAGKWLYRPTCAHSCRRQIIYSPLVCDGDSGGSHSTGSHSHSASPDISCFLANVAFLQTLALCIDEHCDIDGATLGDKQRYWEEGHLATGTLSNFDLPQPALNYLEALEGAQQEAARRTLINLEQGEVLNQTMRISNEDFQAMYNYQLAFEWGEIDHGKNRCVPCVLSVPRCCC
jgi:hypothetical protein